MFKRFYRTRVLYDMSHDTEIDYDKRVILCVPEFAWKVARSLLIGYAFRETTYLASHGTEGYYTPNEAEFDKIDANLSKFIVEDDMCEAITSALEAIKEAIEGVGQVMEETSGCGNPCTEGGSFGAGSSGAPPSPFADTGDNFPEGFSDRAEYDAYKCGVANALIKAMVEDMTWLSSASLVSLVASTLVVALLTPIPFDDVLVLVGIVVSIFLQGILTDASVEVKDYLEGNAEQLVCVLFSSETVLEATDGIGGRFADDLSLTAALLAGSFVNYNAYNALFEKQVVWEHNALTMGVDCSLCVGCALEMAIGTFDGDDFFENAFWGPASDPPGKYVVEFSFLDNGLPCTKDNLVIVPTNINPTPGGGAAGYRLYDVDGEYIYNDDAVPPATDGVATVSFSSNTEGSAIITWVDSE